MAILRWPAYGNWYLGYKGIANLFGKDPPFTNLWIDFRSRSGFASSKSGDLVGLDERNDFSIQMRQSSGGPKFSANYAFKGNTGRFEAAIVDDYWLDVEFTGSVSARCRGEPLTIKGGDTKLVAMSRDERLSAAARLALDKMPADVAQQISGMLTVQSFAIMSASLGVMIAGQVYGGPVALVADLILLTVGVVVLGPQAMEAGEDLIEFWSSATNAQTDEDMDRAASAFARVVAAIGVNALAAILFGKAHKVFKDAWIKPGTRPSRYGGTPRPTTPGRWFWDPNTVRVDFEADLPEGMQGGTNPDTGQISISRTLRGDKLAQLRVVSHERAHQFVTRLASISQITFDVRVWAYERSYLLRYLEETLAEFYASRVLGEPVMDSFKFATRNGYIEARRWRQGLSDIAADKPAQARFRQARSRLTEINGRIVDLERLPRKDRFFNRTHVEINELYDEKAKVEDGLQLFQDILKQFIRVPNEQGGWADFRMKSYVDGDPMIAEIGQLLGTISVAGNAFRIFFTVSRGS